MRLPVRPTVRLRLTILYGALFLLAGALLLVVNYGLVRSRLPPGRVMVAFAPGDPMREARLLGPPDLEARAGPEQAVRVPVDPAERQRIQAAVERSASALRRATLHELVVQSLGALGLMTVASIGMGWLVAGRVLRPLHQITAAARRLSQENLHERISLDGPDDELKQLADTFDAMLARLDAAFESQRRFIANASHELRTPLAIQRTLVDVALSDPTRSPAELAEVGDELRGAIDRSERLIEALLVLARSERGVERHERVDLAAAAADAVRAVGREAADAGVRIDAALPAGAPVLVDGDAVLLERTVSNLVENAVRHNVAGGWARVGVSAQGEAAVVRVSNSGEPIPENAVAGLFEPFRRGSGERVQSSRGAGLGLSIVRTVVHAHRGTVAATPRRDGGLDVAVTLPRSGAR